jgi:CHAT domain-containing protein
MEQNDFEDALNWNRKGQQYMGYEKGMDFNTVSNLHNLCGLLSQEAQILLKQSGKADLKVAKESCEQAMKAIQIALQESEDGESREAINAAEGSNIYEQNIILNNAFYDQTKDKKYWQQSFLSSEQSRAREMIQMLNDRDSEKTNCYPSTIVERATEYRIKIERLKVALDNTLSVKSRDSLQTVLKEVKKQHHALQKQMKTQYPDCWNRLHTFVPLDVATIQKNVLSPDQVMIEYFVGKKNIFFFVINQQGLFVEQREKDPDFEYLINTLDENMEKNNTPGDIIQITTASIKLYQTLIAPVRQYLDGYSRLVIVPDIPLVKVPFHILLKNEVSSPGTWSQYEKNYLIHEFAISYESKYLLVGTPAIDKLEGPSVEDVALPALSNSGLEIDSALSFWPGDRMIHHTIDEFWQLAPQYKIIHIPTHGKAVFKSRASSWLEFKDPSNPSDYAKLYVNDFYSRQLNSDLTIFSACESGRGPLRTREGVLAFGRAALIAGSGSAVVTLWSVKTEKGLKVTTDFHRALKSGMPKDVALQSAMKQYLARTTGYSNFAPHPYYWANWVIYGDMKSIR